MIDPDPLKQTPMCELDRDNRLNKIERSPIPEAKLLIQSDLTSPPKPSGVVVMVDQTPVAVLSLDELKRTAVMVDEMEVRATYVREFFP
jgi:hypothetical protein